VEVIITILEGEEDQWPSEECENVQDISPNGAGPWGMMSVLSGCITVASAAVSDAGIDCVDMVSGGVSALVRDRQDVPEDTMDSSLSRVKLVLDPLPCEHYEILAACVVGYLPSRDEITDIWVRGDIGAATSGDFSRERPSYEELADSAVQAALGAHHVLTVAAKESAEMRLRRLDKI
jgi:exosome complex component MTR3